MTSLFHDAVERLRAAGIESPRADARLLHHRARTHDLSFEQLLLRRLAHEPVAYIVGTKEFWSLDFEVGPAVLIPRPETETLVEQALQELQDRGASYRILDLGTGSGCLLIALLTEFPNAGGIGLDGSRTALQVAQGNIVRHRLGRRCALVEGGWSAAKGGFDLIVANPPYVPTDELGSLPPDVRKYEPVAALDGGPDGLRAYREIAPVLAQHLNQTGLALMELGIDQHDMVSAVMAAEGLEVSRVAPDLAGISRCLVVRNLGPIMQLTTQDTIRS